jgi:hypothetical protein
MDVGINELLKYMIVPYSTIQKVAKKEEYLGRSDIPYATVMVSGTKILLFITSTLCTPDLNKKRGSVFNVHKTRKMRAGDFFFSNKYPIPVNRETNPIILCGINDK